MDTTEAADAAKRDAMQRVAKYLRAQVRHGAPTAKSADSFRIEKHGRDGLKIISYDNGTIATEIGARHPLFGNSGHWYGPAGRQRGRKHFIERQAQFGADVAAERFAEAWAEKFIAMTSYEEA